MMKHKGVLKCQVLLLFLLTLMVLPFSSASCQDSAPAVKKVLFVGNSFTFWWNLPQNVSVMMSERDIPMEAHQSTASGAKWWEHWQGEKELETVSLIESGMYDAVILQNHSLRPIEDLDSFMSYGKKFNVLASTKGSRVYLFMTWPYKYDPYMHDDLAEGYYRLGKEIGAEVIPVGTAWQKAIEMRPDLAIYADDGRHPSACPACRSASERRSPWP